MDERLLLAGLILIFIGFFLVFISPFIGSGSKNTKVEVAVGGFIGPIPFGFATSRDLFYIVLILLIFLLLLNVFLFR